MSDRNPRRRRRRRRSRRDRAGAPAAEKAEADAEAPAAAEPEKRKGARGRERRAPPGTILGMPRFVFVAGAGVVMAFLLITIVQDIVGTTDFDDIGDASLFPDQGRRHLVADETFDAYNSFPPTSGPQPALGAPPGIYGPDAAAPFDTIPDPVEFLPLLEQGGLVVYYDPEALVAAEVENLRAVVERLLTAQPDIALTPLEGLATNPAGLQTPVVATAWRHLLPILSLDEDGLQALREFLAPDPNGFFQRFVLDSGAPAATLSAADAPAPTAEPVTYEIADREDISFSTVVRILYRVRVSEPLTEDDLRRISQEIIDGETSQQDVNAIALFFYLPGTDTTSVYTAGTADWAPDGVWASANTVQSGDYSRHKLGAIDLGGP
ncbi:MAG: DUF3105 domain-containing protein [Dehalococcoidia bacterium]